MDALTIRNNSERAAWGYRAQGINFAGNAGLFDARADAFNTASWMEGGGSLVTGAGTFADRWYWGNRQRGRL